MLSSRRLGVFVLIAATSLVGCFQNKPASQTPDSHSDIFSDRPIRAVPELYVVTLKEPALLQQALRTGDRWLIPHSAKLAVAAEQSAFKTKLAELSANAEIIFTYRLTLNGFALFVAESEIPKIEKITGVDRVTPVKPLERPNALQTAVSAAVALKKVTSASFIGAKDAYALGFTGRGMRVGVIDTGVDYTHRMLGGSGLAADFESVDPNLPSSFFPNLKVTGGIDLAGSDFNAGSAFASGRRPVPDGNPIDEAGHGTHVAGTVAGIGDGIASFDGVAKDAEIHAIKVFGKQGSTMDAVVIAGFEYAVDPNGDLDIADQLDVINLSLGGGFGQPQILYSEAVRNLTRTGMIVVAAAGNSGPIDYIVGAPGTSNEALSVAASIDGSDHNWRFPAVRFISASNPNRLTKALEGTVSKPIAESGPVEGELVDIGLADQELSEELKAKLNGNVALIARGGNPFVEKLKLAFQAGAVGAVVYNNAPGNPIPMGGEGRVEIPAIMISQELGLQLLEEIESESVRIQFQTGEWVEQPELIDSVTEFSSKGPRSEDNLMKPEITAPGRSVISAAMGKGTSVVQLDGTSMASPHVAGAMALLKQARPGLTAQELKALVMNTAKVLSTDQGDYPITLQGAGRIQILQALQSPIVIEPAGLSLGLVSLENVAAGSTPLNIRNTTDQNLTLDLQASGDNGLQIQIPAQVTIPAHSSTVVDVSLLIRIANESQFTTELNGRISVLMGVQRIAQVPVMGIRTFASRVQTVATTASPSIALTNSSVVDGMVLAFNLLGEDDPKRPKTVAQEWKSRSCDLHSVGYRILSKPDSQGTAQEVIQFAFKLYSPLSTWHMCEVSVLIDSNEDGIADQELAGVSTAGVSAGQGAFASLLLDAFKARDIRLNYESEVAQGREGVLDFSPSVLHRGGMAPFEHSTISLIEVPVSVLAKTATGKLNIKVAALAQRGDTMQADDYLGGELGQWQTIEATAQAQPFYGMNEFSAVSRAGASIQVQRGSNEGKLLLYYPMNVHRVGNEDLHFQILD